MRTTGVEVTFFDTTLRDGAQALPEEHQFPNGSKPDIADRIARLGIGVIEAGFPATPGDAEEVEAVARSVGRIDYEVQVWGDEDTTSIRRPPVIAGLARTIPSDIEVTWAAVSPAENPRIHTFISTDPDHMRAKFPGKTPVEVLHMGSEAVRLARELVVGHPSASVEFSAEAASTTDPGYLERVVKEALQQGADIINLPDTVGQRDPFWMKEFYDRAIGWVIAENPNAVISAHNHNDLAMAVPNTLALLQAASEYSRNHGTLVRLQMETTVCGLGERAGNADIFPVAANIFKHSPNMAASVGFEFNPNQSVKIAQAVMCYAGLDVPRQSPIVGSDTNVHRSGIHSSGVVKGGYKIYTPYDPVFWGHAEQAKHEDGKYQGRAGRRAAVRNEEV